MYYNVYDDPIGAAIIEAIDNLPPIDQITVYNTYCDSIESEDHIYAVDDLQDLYFIDPSANTADLIYRIQCDFSSFDLDDDAFYIDGYGHYISGSYRRIAEKCIDPADMARTAIDGANTEALKTFMQSPRDFLALIDLFDAIYPPPPPRRA